MNFTDAAMKKTLLRAQRGVLLAVADASLSRRIARRLALVAGAAPVTLASNFEQVREIAARVAPEAILIDLEILRDQPFETLLGPLAAVTGLILLASPERQAELAGLLSENDVDIVARTGDFIPVAAALIVRRLRWAGALSLASPAEPSGDLGAIFRHEINNPLTGILGNAEMVLAHRERLAPLDIQRLQTVVDLSVRLRETVRRLSNAFESRRNNLKSA